MLSHAILKPMEDQPNRTVFAFPAVQEQEQVQATLQSLAPLRRHLRRDTRTHFENLIRQVLPLLPAYQHVDHLTPIEFILLAFIIELADDLDKAAVNPLNHPPFP
jgi:hypothetical protein